MDTNGPSQMWLPLLLLATLTSALPINVPLESTIYCHDTVGLHPRRLRLADEWAISVDNLPVCYREVIFANNTWQYAPDNALWPHGTSKTVEGKKCEKKKVRVWCSENGCDRKWSSVQDVLAECRVTSAPIGATKNVSIECFDPDADVFIKHFASQEQLSLGELKASCYRSLQLEPPGVWEWSEDGFLPVFHQGIQEANGVECHPNRIVTWCSEDRCDAVWQTVTDVLQLCRTKNE